jgi:hypothetical protein
MRVTIEIELGGAVWSWDDVADAIRATAGSLSDSGANLEEGEKAFIFTSDAEEVGQFIVTDRSIRDFYNLKTEEVA